MYNGQTVFSQVMGYLPRKMFDLAVRRYGGDKRPRGFSCRDQLLCMAFAHLIGRSSLREAVLCLRAGRSLYHCGIRGRVSRSTLADANRAHDARIFMDVAMSLARSVKDDLPVDADLLKLELQAYALDSTTIDLCMKVYPWAFFRRSKAGIKLHVSLDLCTGIPDFILLTNAKTHDVNALDAMHIQPGAFYVMDKAYVDFERFGRIHHTGAFFLTRAKRNLDARVVARSPAEKTQGVISDHALKLCGLKSRQAYQERLRRIRFKDPETGKRLVFLTNNFMLGAPAIALLYKKRWQVELFFKWIKQHLRIRSFYGDTPNAVATQVWIGILVLVLIHRIKADLKLPQSANEIWRVLELSLFEKIPLFELFSTKNQRNATPDPHNTMTLFDL
jgi:IS4 transposase